MHEAQTLNSWFIVAGQRPRRRNWQAHLTLVRKSFRLRLRLTVWRDYPSSSLANSLPFRVKKPSTSLNDFAGASFPILRKWCSYYPRRVVGQPSSKTNYVVLGDNAGPSKLAAINKHNLKTLSEDEFLNLIATRKGPGDGKGLSEKEKKKKDKEEKAIRDSVKEMEAREKAVRAPGSGVIRGCARTFCLGTRSMKMTQLQGEDDRPQDTTLDRSICPADAQRDLQQ